MRHTIKRLTVKNDGFCKSDVPARERIMPVVNRYVKKMSARGWVPYAGISEGNAFAVWEAYVRMCLPSINERAEAELSAVDAGWSFNDKTWILETD